MFYIVFIFVDCFDRIRFFVGNGNIDDCVIRVVFVVDVVIDVGIMVDLCFVGVGMYMYGFFGIIVLVIVGGIFLV